MNAPDRPTVGSPDHVESRERASREWRRRMGDDLPPFRDTNGARETFEPLIWAAVGILLVLSFVVLLTTHWFAK